MNLFLWEVHLGSMAVGANRGEGAAPTKSGAAPGLFLWEARLGPMAVGGNRGEGAAPTKSGAAPGLSLWEAHPRADGCWGQSRRRRRSYKIRRRSRPVFVGGPPSGRWLLGPIAARAPLPQGAAAMGSSSHCLRGDVQ